MTDSPELPKSQERVRGALIAQHDTYKANDAVRTILNYKTFTGIAGPFGVGKSMLSDEVIRLEPSIHPINTTTTRHRKPEDPAGFKTADEGITFASMLQAAQAGALVNFSVIPGSDVYGTYPQDFPAKHTIGPFLPTSIDHIARAGFEDYNFVYIVTPGELWRSYVNKSRRDLPEDRFNSRIGEAVSSIDFALDNTDILHFVRNKDGEQGLNQAAQTIANIALNRLVDTLDDSSAKKYLRQMKAVAQTLRME